MDNNNKQIMKQIFSLILPCKTNLIIVFVCLIVIALTTFFQPLLIQNITDRGIINREFKYLFVMVLFLFIVKITGEGISILQTYNFAKLHNIISVKLSGQMFEKLYHLPLAYFKERNTTEIVNALKLDINTIASVCDEVSALSITAILQIIAGLIGLILINWKMSLIIIAFIPIKFYVVKSFSNKKTKALNKSLKNDYKYYAWLGEQIDGIKEIKLWALFRKKYAEQENIYHKVISSYTENAICDKYYTFGETFLDIILYCIIYLLGGWLVLKDSMTIGGVLAFISYCSYIIVPITLLINVNYYFAKIIPSAIRFYDFLKLSEEKYLITNTAEKALKKEPLIEFKRVQFSYDNRELLKDISFQIRTGDKVALIGLNGSGKSTIFNLLLGFYQPQKGEIKINGKLINELGMETIRKKIAVVDQKPHLYNTTIEKNIDIEGCSSIEEIEQASRKSGAHKFITKFPDGYKHVLGKDGEKLSGGERQKIAIARALVKKSNIVLLDEATNAYDVESNSSSLTGIFQEKTVIIITHKYDELQGINRILRLTDGKINEEAVVRR